MGNWFGCCDGLRHERERKIRVAARETASPGSGSSNSEGGSDDEGVTFHFPPSVLPDVSSPGPEASSPPAPATSTVVAEEATSEAVVLDNQEDSPASTDAAEVTVVERLAAVSTLAAVESGDNSHGNGPAASVPASVPSEPQASVASDQTSGQLGLSPALIAGSDPSTGGNDDTTSSPAATVPLASFATAQPNDQPLPTTSMPCPLQHSLGAQALLPAAPSPQLKDEDKAALEDEGGENGESGEGQGEEEEVQAPEVWQTDGLRDVMGGGGKTSPTIDYDGFSGSGIGGDDSSVSSPVIGPQISGQPLSSGAPFEASYGGGNTSPTIDYDSVSSGSIGDDDNLVSSPVASTQINGKPLPSGGAFEASQRVGGGGRDEEEEGVSRQSEVVIREEPKSGLAESVGVMGGTIEGGSITLPTAPAHGHEALFLIESADVSSGSVHRTASPAPTALGKAKISRESSPSPPSMPFTVRSSVTVSVPSPAAALHDQHESEGQAATEDEKAGQEGAGGGGEQGGARKVCLSFRYGVCEYGHTCLFYHEWARGGEGGEHAGQVENDRGGGKARGGCEIEDVRGVRPGEAKMSDYEGISGGSGGGGDSSLHSPVDSTQVGGLNGQPLCGASVHSRGGSRDATSVPATAPRAESLAGVPISSQALPGSPSIPLVVRPSGANDQQQIKGRAATEYVKEGQKRIGAGGGGGGGGGGEEVRVPKVCSYFLEEGKCRSGTTCRFLHVQAGATAEDRKREADRVLAQKTRQRERKSAKKDQEHKKRYQQERRRKKRQQGQEGEGGAPQEGGEAPLS